MALTTEDLKNITNIVSQVVNKANSQMKIDLRAELRDDLDRMETRLVTAINLLQRDSFSRLDDHEARIRRLEQASSS